jgi:hypothetical protein
VSNAPEREALEVYRRFTALRDEAEAGRVPWTRLADFYTEDGVTIDPIWGRIEGREHIRAYCERSMAGLTGYGWWSRENWTTCEGPRVVSQWDQLARDDCTGSSRALDPYSRGDGLFCLRTRW